MSASVRGSLSAALTNMLKLLPEDPALAEAQAQAILAIVPGQPNTLLLLAAAEAAQGKLEAAIATLKTLTTQDPHHHSAWRDLGDLYTALGDPAQADAAYMHHIAASKTDRAMMEAVGAINDGRLYEAETILRAILNSHPSDVAALHMLAVIAARLDHLNEAEALLHRTLALVPSYAAAKEDLASVLLRKNNGPSSAA